MEVRPTRAETFEHSINALLSKRADLLTEGERIRERLADIRNDIGALDRTLGVLGYEGDLDTMMPREKRHVIFGRGELSKAIFAELRNATEPMSSRDIAREIVTLNGQDSRDRRYLTELTKRVSKALLTMHKQGDVARSVDKSGNYDWRIEYASRMG